MWEVIDRPSIYSGDSKDNKLVVTVYRHEADELYSCYCYDEKRDLLFCGGA